MLYKIEIPLKSFNVKPVGLVGYFDSEGRDIVLPIGSLTVRSPALRAVDDSTCQGSLTQDEHGLFTQSNSVPPKRNGSVEGSIRQSSPLPRLFALAYRIGNRNFILSFASFADFRYFSSTGRNNLENNLYIGS